MFHRSKTDLIKAAFIFATTDTGYDETETSESLFNFSILKMRMSSRPGHSRQ